MLPDRPGDSFAPDERGASEVVAVALLIGIVLIGVTGVLLVGTPQLLESQEAVETRQAEQAFVQFDSATARVATGGTTSQRVDLGLQANEGTLDIENDTGNVTVTYIDVETDDEREVMNTSLGTMVYENGDTTVGYQGGGVWRRDGNGSVMVSPPEINFRNETLTMSFVKTRGGSVYSGVQVSRTNATERFPDPSENLTNRVENTIIEISIQSRYYRAWGSFFAQETRSTVQYEHSEERVTVFLLALPEDFAPNAGVVATSGTGELRLEGNGPYVDSYNSSVGPYADSSTDDGEVEAAGDVIMKGSSEIDGDVRSGADISVEGSALLDGNASANGTITGTSQITGETKNNTSNIIEFPPINRQVEDKTETLRERNDNNDTSVIENNELNISGGSATLGPGQYYLENFHLQGETLVLNTTGGNITIAVRDWMLVEKSGGVNSHIEVEGDGNVQLYIASENKTDDVSIPGGGGAPGDLNDEAHFFVERDGSIEVDGQESNRFQIYAPDNFAGAVAGSSSEHPNVTMVVIAPTGPSGDGQFYVKQGDVYGAVMTGNLTVGQYGAIHFDRALLNEELLVSPQISRFKYLYVTEYEVEVESS